MINFCILTIGKIFIGSVLICSLFVSMNFPVFLFFFSYATSVSECCVLNSVFQGLHANSVSYYILKKMLLFSLTCMFL